MMCSKWLFIFILFVICPAFAPAQSGDGHSQKLDPENFILNSGNMDNALYRIQKERRITIAFLGGSITNMNGWRNLVMKYLQDSFPTTAFTFINAGVPSLGSVPDAFRLRRDVLSKGRIDLLFIESAVNDRVNATPPIQQRRALEGIVRQAYYSNPFINIIFMAFADEQKIKDYDNGSEPLEVKIHEEVSQYYHLPFINLAKEVASRITNREFTWQNDFKSLHPSPFGMQLYFKTISTLLAKEFTGKNPGRLRAVKLPGPLQKLNYAHADYVAVAHAIHKNGFIINSSWQPADSAKTRPGFVGMPMLVAEMPGASFDLEFKGVSAGIAVVSGPDAGTIAYSIDGGKPTKLDTYSPYSKSLHLPQYFVLADDLADKKHVLRISILQEHNSESTGCALRVIYFLVNK